jgi:LDH2 family malate/lactate/ureidoglycolate dehydrogenase
MALIGGPKGWGIAILIDIMSGVLSGATFGGEVGDQYKDTKPQDIGHCFITIKPDVFLSTDNFKARIDTLVKRVHGIIPAPGFDKVISPGEPEHRLGVQRRKEGIPYADGEKNMFVDAAKLFEVAELALMRLHCLLTELKQDYMNFSLPSFLVAVCFNVVIGRYGCGIITI